MRLMPGSRGGALWRFALAAVVVILLSATATAVAGLLQFKDFAGDLSLTPALKRVPVTIADPGDPQTLLLIGSDHRAGTPWTDSNTDTMMLVRLDPSSSTVNVLSVPRDLEVKLPQRGGMANAKLNAAYSLGGPQLLVQTLGQQVFPGIQVNHVIDVNFGGFQAMVDAIGCVYADVDHRYYNDTAVTDYSSIDIQPGYQKLCDANALAFVRFRHTDTDIVRNARQQDFLRWAKDQFSTSSLVSERNELLTVFGEHAQTDASLHSVDGLINLFNLIAFSAGRTVKQIPFPAILLPCPITATGQDPCFVSATASAEQQAYVQFMTPTNSSPVAHPSSSSASGGGPSSAPSSGSGPASSSGAGKASPPGVVTDLADGSAQAAGLSGAGMPVYFPAQIAAGSQYCTSAVCTEGPVPNSYPRAYTIQDQHGASHLDVGVKFGPLRLG